MRSVLLSTTFFLLLSTCLMAQPGNDDCSGLIDLGPVPACTDDIFTNVDATPSDIGFGNSPSCFNGGTVQNDVWFSFQTTTDLVNLSIFVTGTLDGPNGTLLTNPQVALYRGACQVDGLAELACISAPNGDALVRLDVLGLSPNETYFLRINDYSATATPNWGDFQLCVDEYVPEINMGDSESSTACFGTLFDSGGPDGDYSDGENLTFTICPNETHFCINIDLIDFMIEQGFDNLRFYAGTDTNAPLIATATGFSNGEFPIQVSSSCVTVEFTSDGSATQPGFELTWQCTPLACDGSTVDNPSVINSIPFSTSGETTCEGAATFAASPCNNDAFLGGPETVFVYESPGGICAQIEVTNAAQGTGVIVLDGPPDDPETTCVGQSASGLIGSANFETPGTYYIVVANPFGCTTFDLSLEEADCQLSGALADALCNPLNGCIEDGGVPSVFNFEDGFQDIDVETDINGGCWLGFGAQPDFIWFTIQAQADGPFGFILESADNPSDIDFNVWGPFTENEVCDNQADVINFIENNQPIRSSWAGGADPTGLASVHPVTGIDVTDEYDCGATPGAGGDDFVSVINSQVGEVYVVLINDWGNNIGDAGISVDWAPSQPEVLAPVPIEVMGGDTAICAGEEVQLLIDTPVDNIQWFGDTSSLSCTFCADPIATPEQTTIYKAVVDAVCYTDTVELLVSVFDVDAGPDLTICRNQEFDIEAGSDFPNATYTWQAPDEVTLSCTDCSTPTVSSAAAGTYTLSVTLDGPNCTVSDEMELTVLPNDAPEFEIIEDTQICEEESISIGGPSSAGVTYTWTSVPDGFTSDVSNPVVMPDTTTAYFLSIVGGNCPLPIVDSVLVTVFDNPIIDISSDTMVCQGDTISLGSTVIEDDVTYQWEGPEEIIDATDPNTQAVPQSDGVYTLTANRGVCVTTESLNVGIVEIEIEVTPEDTVRICKGEPVNLEATVAPVGSTVTWAPDDGSLSDNTGLNVTATPETATTYTATVEVDGCIRTDEMTILVDSLPVFLDIMPADTMICQGELVVLTSQTFEPSDFPDIEFQWEPLFGAQSQDTLFNYVVQPDSTTEYVRVSTNGLCVESDTAVVNVTPATAISIVPADTVICSGEEVQLNVVFDGDGELEDLSWTPENNISCLDCLDPVVTPTSTTSYMVTAEFMGCPLAASTNITVILPPSVALNPNTTICQGDAIQLNLSSDAISSYSWTSPDDPDFSSTDPELTVIPETTTTYDLEASNNCGTFNYSITVQVVEEPMLMIDDLNLVGCASDPVTLSASSDAPDFVTEVFLWEYAGNTENGETITIEGLTDSIPVDFTYTYGTAEGVCGTFTASGELFLAPAPQLDIPDQIDLCLGETALLNNNPDFELTTYTWTAPGYNSNEPDPIVQPSETTVYNVVAETPGCDPIVDSVLVTVTPMVEMTLGEDFEVGRMDSFSITPMITPPGDYPATYDWSWGNNTASTPTVQIDSISETTDFILNYTYGPGCGFISDTVTVSLVRFDIPNVFTPNNDGLNDVFRVVHNASTINVDVFKVFNRWGQVVYEARNNDGWDGRVNGKIAPSDVYVYHLVFRLGDTADGEPEVKSGDVTLLR